MGTITSRSMISSSMSVIVLPRLAHAGEEGLLYARSTARRDYTVVQHSTSDRDLRLAARSTHAARCSTQIAGDVSRGVSDGARTRDNRDQNLAGHPYGPA